MGRKRQLETSQPPAKCRKIYDLFARKPCSSTDDLFDNRACDNIVESVPSPTKQTTSTTPIETTPGATPVDSTSARKMLTPSKGRRFRDEWRHGRPWLLYDAQKKEMYCDTCKRAQVVNTFTSGCTIMKIENVTKHLNGKGENSHSAAEKIVASGNNFKAAQAHHVRKSEESITGALQNIYFMAKHSLPNSIFGDLNELCIKQGCESLRNLKVDRHTTYTHSDSIAEFQDAICGVIHDDMMSAIGNKPYSVMIDESTDIATDQNMIVYVRYLDQQLGRYVPQSCLFDVRRLREGATAEKVCDELLESLSAGGLDLGRMCGMSTDGASVMVGKKSGVVTRIRSQVPGLLTTHCISHRLALASGGAADKVQYLVKYQELLNAIYSYFDRAAKNIARLDCILEVLNESRSESKATRFKQVFHTRWLSFEGSVKAVVTNYSALLSVLQEDKRAKAQGVLKSISCYKFLYCTYYLADVLKSLGILCRSFQASKIDHSQVGGLLESTVESIRALESESGVNMQKFESVVPAVASESFEFDGHVLRDSEKQRNEAKSACKKFSENLLENLESRFSDKDDGVVLSAICTVFDPLEFGKSDGESKKLTDSIDVVCQFVEKANVGMGDSEQAREEIGMFHKMVLKSHSQSCNLVDDVVQVAFRLKESVPIVCELAVILLTVPVSSVDCERGFSRQNLVKTKLRNRLSTRRLYELMKISLDGPEAGVFDFKRAFDKWAEKKQRRICTGWK